MEGFFAETAVLDPHRLFLPAAFVVSGSPPRSALAGDILLLVVKDILRAAKAFGVVLWKRRKKEREHTETPQVRGMMRTMSPDANRLQQRGVKQEK